MQLTSEVVGVLISENKQRIYNGSKPRQQVLTFTNIRLGSFGETIYELYGSLAKVMRIT